MSVTLENTINDALRPSVFPPEIQDRYFAPKSKLEHINNSSVTRAFWPNSTSFESLEKPRRDLVAFISEKSREILAIGICMNISKRDLRRMMQRFKAKGLSDRDLPFSDAQIDEIWVENEGSRRSFKSHQHCFRPYHFPGEDRYSVITLEPKVVLPVLESTEMSEGQFGIVYKVRLHKDVLDRNHPIYKTQCLAAIKRLRASNQKQKARKAWNREVTALQSICELGLPNVVETVAMMTIGTKQYFVFPWAHGGNLRDFWKRNDGRRSDFIQKHIPDIIEQLVGLTDALAKLHAFKHNKVASYRHGDLKPENILVFNRDKGNLPGIWKIADLGLARYHLKATGDRTYVTSNSGAGTISYQPPESFKKTAPATTRLYDIWCMGCILLQLMTWLLYGKSRIDDLTKNTKSVFIGHQSSYWSGAYNDEKGFHDIKVHPKVKSLMSEMKRDVQGSRALEELLSIIEDKALVIKLPHKATVPEDGRRTNAEALHKSLLKIKRACRDKDYWFHGDIVKMINNQTSQPQVPKGKAKPVAGGKGPKLNNKWERFSDELFVITLLNRPELRDSINPDMVRKAKLCTKCDNMDFFAERFQIIDAFQDLRKDASQCDFCKMRWIFGRNSYSSTTQHILFDRIGSDLHLNRRPVISLLACHEDSEFKNDMSNHIVSGPQIGLPRLPPVGSETHFSIIRHWMEECDEHHENCRPLKNADARLPTRLMDVREPGDSGVRLFETKDDDSYEYLALSHPWGPNRSSHFCTYPENLDRHLREILLKDLPRTFQDAVQVTRSLNHRYLWIDSICIIQGPKGDFNEQAKHMEGIFRQASCVLAASCATGQQDGFLKPRDDRSCLEIDHSLADRPPIYACDFIDNFEQHALHSHLNRRGWVLQERALARRTIFFTEKQTYWECGAGVRCETTMKMNNKLASFLGDSRFPEVGMKSTHGGKIRLYQDLYSKYSRLGLSYDADRPVAIAGIEKRLISSFNVRGGFGVLDDEHRGLLWRSLLWKRALDATSGLKRIAFDSQKDDPVAINSPPSWSWMAYNGPIDYLDLPFDGVDWEEDDIRSRWSSGAGKSWSYSGGRSSCPLELTVRGRPFGLQTARTSVEAGIILDDPDMTDELDPGLKCVVLGRSKSQVQESTHARTHYVLLVTLTEPQDGDSFPSYNRVGVGYMPGALIDFDKRTVQGELR